MSKLACKCGAVLSDVTQEDGDAYWGVMYSNGEKSLAEAEASKQVESLVAAFGCGEGKKWLERYFGGDYPTDMNLSSYISDIIMVCFQKVGLSYGRCKQCKSILIQGQKDSHVYTFYSP